MTKQQLAAIHAFRLRPERVTGGTFGRAEYDLVLINIGHVRADATSGAISSKALTNVGYERVMAFIEAVIEKYDKDVGRQWRGGDDRRRAGLCNRRQEWEIHQLHAQLINGGGPRYTLDGIANRQSKQRTTRIHELTPDEASGVIEMLKAALGRITPT